MFSLTPKVFDREMNLKMLTQSCWSKKETDQGGPRASITSKIELFAKIGNGFQPLTIIIKSSILDIEGILFPPLLMIYP